MSLRLKTERESMSSFKPSKTFEDFDQQGGCSTSVVEELKLAPALGEWRQLTRLHVSVDL